MGKIVIQLEMKFHVSRKKGNQIVRQTLNQIDLNTIQAKIQLLNLIFNIIDKEEKKLKKYDMSASQISFIVTALMRDENYITEQEIEDITLEIERLSRIVQYENVQSVPSFDYAKIKNDEVKTKIQNIEKLLISQKRYSKETDDVLQAELTDLHKLVGSMRSVTAVEKQQVVAALGLGKGHWYKCPNGHYYVIADCGGANQISRCNECGARIGGTNHQLLPGQSFAPEIDNAPHPAWSEAANLANYRL